MCWHLQHFQKPFVARLEGRDWAWDGVLVAGSDLVLRPKHMMKSGTIREP